MAPDDLRTKFAMQAVDLAGLFSLLIGERPLTGPVTYHVELSAPDGPSTGGGIQAVQHIKLIPADGGATLVAGWANQIERVAELRTLNYLNELHAERFASSALSPPPSPSERLDRVQYDELLERMRTFFADKEIRATVVDASEPRTVVRPSVAPPSRRPEPVWMALLVAGVVLSVSLGVYLALVLARR
jgi:hypothetical protein